MKLFIGLFCALITTAAMADDETAVGVVDRMTCAEIQERITELSAEEEPDDYTLEEIAKLKGDLRRSCTKSAGGRRSAAASRVIVETSAVESDEYEEPVMEDIEEEAEEVVEKPKPKKKKAKKQQIEEPVIEEETVVEEDSESEEAAKEKLNKELANLNSGLCIDGSVPNRFGCCGDELFKDLGNMVFACCPKDGGDCFPPIK